MMQNGRKQQQKMTQRRTDIIGKRIPVTATNYAETNYISVTDSMVTHNVQQRSLA